MENNKAFVAILDNIQSIEGADKIVSADVMLNGIKITQVVVSKDTLPKTTVVYFDSNMSIEQSVIDAIDKLSPDYGKEGFLSLGNYLGKNGRVRVVRLRGVISNGLAVEVGKIFRFAKDEKPDEGFSFTKLGDTEICHKYMPPLKIQGQGVGKKGKSNRSKLRITPEQFHYHVDTSQLLRNIGNIHPDQIVSISRKIHGTSAIFSRTLVKRPLKFWESILKFFHVNVKEHVYGDIISSRSVIKSIDIGQDTYKKPEQGFYKVDVWTEAGNKFFKGKLKDGETVYYEIVGYLPNSQSMIQKGYDYGAKEGEYKIAVYRITMAEGEEVKEYSWPEMKARCVELGVPMVEEFFYGKITDLFPITETVPVENPTSEDILTHWRTGLVKFLKDKYLEKDCLDCKKRVPDEGAVIRVEGKGIEVYKYKSEKFLLGESKLAEEGQADIEDTQE